MTRGKHTARREGTGRAGWGIVGTVFGLLLAISVPGLAEVNAVTPSTNAINKTNGWAHFNVIETRVGEVDVEFVSTRSFASCFEYRIDGEDPTVSTNNFNPAIVDGLWTFVCVNNSTAERTFAADSHVEIRMVFGAEGDERFDWTRVDVLPPPMDACKSGGFEEEGFSNQGRCIASVQANERAGHGTDGPPRGRR